MKAYVTKTVIALLWALSFGAAPSAAASPMQDPAPAAPAPAQPSSTPPPSDRAVDPSEPDFTLIGLPTTLRMPKFASAFRVTHRFTRSRTSAFAVWSGGQ